MFYDRALADNVIGYIFTDVAKLDLETHLPIIVDFWDSMLSTPGPTPGTGGIRLPSTRSCTRIAATPEHFQRWLEIFTTTIDECSR